MFVWSHPSPKNRQMIRTRSVFATCGSNNMADIWVDVFVEQSPAGIRSHIPVLIISIKVPLRRLVVNYNQEDRHAFDYEFTAVM